ncbi:MAG: AsmA family protein [Nitrospiraceae bacterium]|nr:MAG: AsmA family protein [Nitrospiraceae bacterium]
MKKILLIVIAVSALIAVSLTILIKTFVTPERVKAFLVPRAEETLGRKISIGGMSIGLFKGISVKDLALREADEKSDFVTCRDFVLKFKLLPLLSGRLIIDELKFVSPEVRILRDGTGRFNFEDIGKKEKPGEIKTEKQAAEAEGLPVSLTVNNVSMKDARFSFADHTKKLPGTRGTFNLAVSIKSMGGARLSSEGEIDFKLEEAVLQPSGKKIKNIQAAMKYAMSVDLKSKDLHIERGEMKIQGFPLSFSGDIRNFSEAPEIDMAVLVPKLKLQELQKEISAHAGLKGLALSGGFAADLKLKGQIRKPETLKADGLITLDKAAVSYKDIDTTLNGAVKLEGQSIGINISGAIGKNEADLKGSVSNIFSTPDINLNLHSKQLFLDELIPAGKTTSKKTPDEGRPPQARPLSEARPLNLNLTAEGEIRIGSASYKDIRMSDFHAKYKFRNNKIEISKMTAAAGKGKMNISSVADLSKPGYAYNLAGNLDSLHADEIVNSFFPKAKDTVFGLLSANLKLTGAGTLPESIKKNLVADGDFTIKNGKITATQLTRSLALFLNIKELETIDLKQADGTIRIRNGVARLDSIFSSDDIAMDPSGYIGLNETLDLAFDLKLSPRLTGKTMGSNIAKYIKDESGWGMIPLKVSGTFSNPVYAVDVAKAGKRVIRKEAEKAIEKLFKKDKGTEGDKTPREQKPVEDLLKEILR